MKRNVKKLINSKILTNIKYILAIFFFGELFIYILSIVYDKKLYYFWLVLVSVLAVYFIYYSFIFLVKIAKRKRYDIILSIIIALFLLIYLHFNIVQEFIENFPNSVQVLSGYILTIWSVLALMIFGLYYYFLKKGTKPKELKEPYFLSDEPIQDKEGEKEDVFGFEDDAKNFAEQVLNNGSSNSIVFGIDAPWGSGKSSYLYFCKKYWKNGRDKENEKENVIVFEFNPLRFGKSSDVFKMFVKELLKKVNEDYYDPEAGSELRKYVKLISGISFGPFGISLPFSNSISSEEAFENLNEYLKNFDKKIIVLIDDLDRIPLEKVKTVIDIVKRSFVLPNITYILCYDTENINSFDTNLKETYIHNPEKDLIENVNREKIDNTKIVEYFEKVVNVKKTLFSSRDKMKRYFEKEIIKISSSLEEKIKKALKDIFRYEEFHNYTHYTGDLRKIKRFINVYKMIMLDEDSAKKLESYDINFIDLFHLILIYINYPKIFLKIYITETEGGKEFFSLQYDYNIEKKEEEFDNSEKYKSYIKYLKKEEAFLLNKIFNIKIFEQKITKVDKSTRAAFNGTTGTGRNLEDYLKLIVYKKVPTKGNQFTFHFKNMSRIIDEESNIYNIIGENKEYKFGKNNNGEKYRSIFFDILFENIGGTEYKKAQEIIDYILDNVQAYSVVINEKLNIGLRKNLMLYLVDMLNKKGWKDEDGESVNNANKKNLKGIAERIFGEEEFKDRGILNKLSSKKQGVLGIYDLMLFRLYCSQDRSGDFYNLYDSLAYHDNPDIETNGIVGEKVVQQMREMSQKCFEIVKSEYIDTEVNIFEEIRKISKKELYGESYEFAKSNLENFEENYRRERNRITSFVIYQISNDKINLGIGCGFYNESGTGDEKGIKKVFSKYLFETCFNSENENNFEYFIDYLLLNLEMKDHLSRKDEYLPDFKKFTVMLDEDQLIKYWDNNKKEIKKYFRGKDKTIYTINYIATYREDLEDLFKVLDEAAKEKLQDI